MEWRGYLERLRGWWPFRLLPFSTPAWLFGVPVSEGLEKVLPWLKQIDYTTRIMDQRKYAIVMAPEYQLGKIDFIWERY